jgi:hypothetical protein
MPHYQPYRRVSSQSPPLIHVPLVPQKRWNTNPSIFIEEYCEEEEKEQPKSESFKSEVEMRNASRETLCMSNDSLPALSVNDIKSFGDLSQIPFIDDDSNDSAPCRILIDRDGCQKDDDGSKPCRKTVSFDVIKTGPAHQHLFSRSSSHGKNFLPKNTFIPPKKSNYTDKNPPLFHAATSRRAMSDVRTTKDGYVDRSHSVPIKSSSSLSSLCHGAPSQNDHDHCTLVDKLIRMRREERCEREQQLHCVNACHGQKKRPNYKIKWDEIGGNERKKCGEKEVICAGKVKALTTFFNTLPYMTSNECGCSNIVHQSTPNLSSTRHADEDKLNEEEMARVREQLREWSEFGLKKKKKKDKLACTFMKRATSSPVLCLENEAYNECKRYHDVLNRLDKVHVPKHCSLSDLHCTESPCLPDCFLLRKTSHCRPACENIENIPIAVKRDDLKSEKHRCRSACFNVKDPAKRRKKKLLKMRAVQQKNLNLLDDDDDDNESLII